MAVVLTLVQTRQIRINIHKGNDTKTQYKQHKTQQIQAHVLPKHPHNCQNTHTLQNQQLTHTHTHILQNPHIHTPTHSSNNKEGLDVISNNRRSVGFSVGRNRDVCQCFFETSLYDVDRDTEAHEIITATKNIHYTNAYVMVAKCENYSLVLRNSDRYRHVPIPLLLSPVNCLEIFPVSNTFSFTVAKLPVF